MKKLPEKKNPIKNTYKPSTQDEELVNVIYAEVDDMVEKRGQQRSEFNDRNLKDYTDDGNKRLNAYVPTRESQEKDEWQANIALPTIRTLQKKMLAGFSLQVPDMEVMVFGENNKIDVDRGEISKWLIRGSYMQEENPVMENFWESWHASSDGTVIKYEGYLKTKTDRKFIKSYDITTGEVDFEEREVTIDDRCISIILPILEFFVKDFYIYDVQDQPSLAWIRYYDKDVFDFEFGKYPNAKHVKTGARLDADLTGFYQKKKWETRTGENRIEVVRYYNKVKDQYVIIANGVLLLDAPLLWQSNGNKVYPFAKTIWEPFTGKHFFYGKSLADVEMGLYDVYNALLNSTIDKEYRSLNKPLLVGLVNADMLELEDEYVSTDTKIYVEDVSQIIQMPYEGINSADVAMIELIAGAIESAAPSLPSLMSQKQATAREVVIAEEKISQLKSIHKNLLVDLWRQKYYLRLANIQMNYPQPKTIMEDGKKKEIYKTYIIQNALLDKETNERGTLAVQFRDVSEKQRIILQKELSKEEKIMEKKGMNYRKVILSSSYLDDHRYQIEVVPETLYQASLAKKQSSTLEKLSLMQQMFPEIFMANREEYFSQFAQAFDDDPEAALKKLEDFATAMKGMQGGQGMPQAPPQR